MARKMVCEWGMSEKMGPLTYGSKEEPIFLGRDTGNNKNFSDETAMLIDQEVKSLVMGGYKTAHKIITDHRDSLEKMALALLDRETLNLAEINEIIDGKSPPNDESGHNPIPDSVPTKNDNSKPTLSDGSDGIMGGGGLPDPHPA